MDIDGPSHKSHNPYHPEALAILFLTPTPNTIYAGEALSTLIAIVWHGPCCERGVIVLKGSRGSVEVEALPETRDRSQGLRVLSEQKYFKASGILPD